MALKIISINMEFDRHFSRIFPFINKMKPDVVVMQEVFARDIPMIEKTVGMKSVFSPLNYFHGMENSLHGILSLSSLPIKKSAYFYYRGDEITLPTVRLGHGEAANIARCLLSIEVQKSSKSYNVINTHFTWTPDGMPSDKQYEDIEILLKLLSAIPEFILCGDFNAPRGGPIFAKIASKYKDNVPPHITTTIDKELHKAGDLKLVVDGVFTTSGYTVEELEVFSGLSDHCGIMAIVS